MGEQRIGGLDEAGRGPLAGPVTAGACLLPLDFDRSLLKDSKVLSERKREDVSKLLQSQAAWGLGWCSAEEIDRVNILQASLIAMERAWLDLQTRFPDWPVDLVIVDGTFVPSLDLPRKALVRADALIPEVSAASILAKVARDQFMMEADEQYPQYGFAQHKGYPTKQHRKALAVFGPCPLHRLTFRGVVQTSL